MSAKIPGGCTLWARQSIESEIFYYKPDKWFKIWFYIVNRVNFKDSNLFKRGSALITYDEIMQKTKCSKTQVSKCVKWLEREDMLESLRTTRGRVRIVSNYAAYQDIENYRDDKETTKEKTSRLPGDDLEASPIVEERKKLIKKENNIIKINKKKFLDFVLISEEEYEKLVSTLGMDLATSMIEKLNNYIGSTGKKYKSHYFTILNWSKKEPRPGASKGINLNNLPDWKKAKMIEDKIQEQEIDAILADASKYIN